MSLKLGDFLSEVTIPSTELGKGDTCQDSDLIGSARTEELAQDYVDRGRGLCGYLHALALSGKLIRLTFLAVRKNWEELTCPLTKLHMRKPMRPLGRQENLSVSRYELKTCKKAVKSVTKCKHFEVYLEGTSLHFTSLHFHLLFVIHFLQHCREYKATQAEVFSIKSSERRRMERFHDKDVYLDAKKKEEWVMEASSILFIGASGSGSDMYNQLQYVLGKCGLPVDRDAARRLFNSRADARTKERGLKIPSDHFGTQNQASFVLPLLRVCQFSINPPLTMKTINGMEEVFPLVQWINDPDTAQRGGVYQRFILQPWIAESESTAVVGTLLASSWADVQSISDCYVMLFEKLNGKGCSSGGHGFVKRVQIVADRMRMETHGGGKGKKRTHEWRPWGFKILVTESELQYSDISLIQEALVDHPLTKGKVDINGLRMLFIPANNSVKANDEEIVGSMDQVPFVLLNGTSAPKLTYILEVLDAIGIELAEILSISYSRSYGYKGLKMMAHDHNVLLRFSSLSTAIQLSQWWNGLDVANMVTPLTRTSAIYICEDVPLLEQDIEPRLQQQRPVLDYNEYMRHCGKVDASSSKICGPTIKSVGSVSVSKGSYTYAEVARTNKRKAESSISTDDSSSCSWSEMTPGEELLILQNVVNEAFRRKPKETMQLLAKETQQMLHALCQHYGTNVNDALLDAEEIKNIAADFKCTKLKNIVTRASAAVGTCVTRASKDRIDTGGNTEESMEIVGYSEPVGMIEPEDQLLIDLGMQSSDEEYFPEIYSDLEDGSSYASSSDEDEYEEFICYDKKHYHVTLSHGACGYVSICAVIMHAAGDLLAVNPGIYLGNMELLRLHLWQVSQAPEMKKHDKICKKLRVAAAILESDRWRDVLQENKELWLTVAETTIIMQAFDVPCRSWMWTSCGYKCFNNGVKQTEPFCYNLMYHMGHFYVHPDTLAREIPAHMLCNKPVPHWLCGGSIYTVWEDNEEEAHEFWNLIDDHMIQRSTTCCRIYPPIADVSPAVRYYCNKEERLLSELVDLSGADPMDGRLLKFYWENYGFNKWIGMGRRQMFNINFTCAVAKRFIAADTLLAPVVGILTPTINSVFAVPCGNILSEVAGMNCYIDPLPVGYDTGYYLFLGAEELYGRVKLPDNVSRYARVAWPSIGVAPNAKYHNVAGETTIWIVATTDIGKGDIIWIQPAAELQLGLHPAVLLSNPPSPSGKNACHVPQHWEYKVIECILPSECESEDSEDGGYMVKYVFFAVFILMSNKNSDLMDLQTASVIAKRGRRCANNVFSGGFNRKWLKVISICSMGNVSSCMACGSKLRISSIKIDMLILIFNSAPYSGYSVTSKFDFWRTMSTKIWLQMSCYITKQFGPAYSSDNAGDGPEDAMEVVANAYGAELEATETGFEMAEWTVEDEKRLRIACWNCNGHLVTSGAETIVGLVRYMKLDVLMLSDTRLDKRAAGYHTKNIKRTLRGYSVICMNTSRSSYTRGGGARMNTMGGTIFIISPRCAHRIVDTGDDESGLGIAGYVKVIVGGLKLCFMSMYQPIGNDKSGDSTVLARLQSHLHKMRINDSPKLYILNVLTKWITACRLKGFIPIVGGDFNADPLLTSGSKLQVWARENNLGNVLQAAIHGQFNTHMVKGVPTSCIDHIYTDDMVWDQIVEGRVVRKPCLTAVSDHCVIGITLSWPEGLAVAKDKFTEIEGLKRIELNHHNAEQVSDYQNDMEIWFMNQKDDLLQKDPGDGLAMLMDQSVNTIREYIEDKIHLREKTGFRSAYKNGYSPCFMAIKSAYMLVLCYHQNLVRVQKRHELRYVYEDFNIKYWQLSIAWQKKYPVADFAGDDVTLRAHGKASDVLMRIRLADHVTAEELYKYAKELRGLMHGRMRVEYRKRLSKRTALMEELRQQKRIGPIFRMVNIKDKPSLDLSVINIKGEAVTDPYDIHVHLTNHFAQWYKIPEGLHDVALAFQNNYYWREVVDGVGNYQGPVEHGFMIQDFFDACECRATDFQRQKMQEAVFQAVSEQEYRDEIYLMKYGKAPGPTGVTANMIKAWPDIIHEQVLEWLNQIWSTRQIPSWWLTGHLKPIPKTGEQSLDNLRPLGLYEISRKILTAIIIKRVHRVWEEYEMLNPNQHAFRRGLSTTHAIMRLVNVSEDAAERNVPLWQILWDFRRAFDSIPFNFIRLALVRLAVPEDIVDFLLFMMEHNRMTVASPHHLARHVKEGSCECMDESFRQERGTGQGDPPSPVIWIAIFDVLLSMLTRTDGTGEFVAQGAACEVYNASDTAYADDLATISSSHHMQQIKADMVCTFCACTGMQISLSKIRAFSVNCTAPAPGIVLRDSQWGASIVAPSTDQVAMKYLGFHSDHVGGDDKAFEITLSYLQNVTMQLIHCHASKAAKLLIYRMQIVPKVLYMATKACWNLDQYRRLDRYAARILKHIGSQMPSSANIMMFFPEDLCGSGLHSISNLAQAQKWGEFARVLDSNTEASDAAKGLLERAMRQTVQQAPSSQPRTLLYQNLPYLKGYAGSLVEWGNEVGHCLHNTAAYEYSDSNKAILPFLYNEDVDDKIISQLQQKDLTVQGELVRRLQNGTMHWASDETTMLVRARIGGTALIDAPTDEGIILNTGQMYSVNGSIFEILGVVKNTSKVMCYVWNRSTSDPNIISRSIHYDLAICQVEVTIFQEEVQRLITIPCKQSGKSTGLMDCKRRIVAATLCSAPSVGTLREFTVPRCVEWMIQQINELKALHGCEYSVYTDGSSRSKKEIPMREVLWSEKQRMTHYDTSAAIIAIADSEHWENYGCVVICLDNSTLENCGLQAYEAELIALVAAMHIQNEIQSNVYTDCKGAKETVELACCKGAKRSGLSRVRPIISSLTVLKQRPIISWIRSHPERNQRQDLWTTTDWGIFLADLAAEGDLEGLSEMVETNVFHEDIVLVSKELIMPGQWFWAIGLSGVPSLSSEAQLHAYDDVSKYLSKRDEGRESRGDDARWVGASLGVANKCWRTIAEGILGSNIILKNVLDKYWHGRNRAKGMTGREAADLQACCYCGMLDSQEHIILECDHEDLRAIRDDAANKLHIAAQEEMRKLKDSDVFQQRIIRFINNNALNTEYDFSRLWLGMWRFSTLWDALDLRRDALQHQPVCLKFDVAMHIQDIIINLTKPLAQAVWDMMKIRNELEYKSKIGQYRAEWLGEPLSKRRCLRDSLCEQDDATNMSQQSVPLVSKNRTETRRASSCTRAKKNKKTYDKCKNSTKRQKKRKSHKRLLADNIDVNSSRTVDREFDITPMDIVGTVSSPRGETETCDYDHD